MKKFEFILMLIVFLFEANSGSKYYRWIMTVYTRKSFRASFWVNYHQYDNRSTYANGLVAGNGFDITDTVFYHDKPTIKVFFSQRSLGQLRSMYFHLDSQLLKYIYQVTIELRDLNWKANLSNPPVPFAKKSYYVNGCQSKKMYGINCDKNCMCREPPDKFDRWCDEFTGTCTKGCPPGWKGSSCNIIEKCKKNYFGTFCQKKCHCSGEGGCERHSGKCLSGICKIGYTGEYCQPCPDGTFGKQCSKKCNCYRNYICQRSNGSCGVHGCPLGFAGHSCQIKRECPEGHFGKACIKCGECKPLCISSKCLTSCNPVNGSCLSRQCAKHFTGPQCLQCEASKYGRNCQYTCGHCASGSCDTVTGHCDFQGCSPGYLGVKCDQECTKNYYGLNCVKKCSKYCKQPCNIVNGHCSPCKYLWKGPRCETRIFVCRGRKYGTYCNYDCGKCVNNEKCRSDGVCINGCADGFYGAKCLSGCNPGRHGKNCVEFCGVCKNWEVCDTISGNCTDGCMGNFIKPLCKVCPRGWFGHECLDRCGHCKDNADCHTISGACEDGCAPNFTGHFCTIREKLP